MLPARKTASIHKTLSVVRWKTTGVVDKRCTVVSSQSLTDLTHLLVSSRFKARSVIWAG